MNKMSVRVSALSSFVVSHMKVDLAGIRLPSFRFPTLPYGFDASSGTPSIRRTFGSHPPSSPKNGTRLSGSSAVASDRAFRVFLDSKIPRFRILSFRRKPKLSYEDETRSNSRRLRPSSAFSDVLPVRIRISGGRVSAGERLGSRARSF